jgi:hypothetical protein
MIMALFLILVLLLLIGIGIFVRREVFKQRGDFGPPLLLDGRSVMALSPSAAEINPHDAQDRLHVRPCRHRER